MNKIRSRFVGLIALLIGVVWCGEAPALMMGGGAGPITVVIPGGLPTNHLNLVAYLQGLGQVQRNLDITRLIIWDIWNRPATFARVNNIINTINVGGVVNFGLPVLHNNIIRVPMHGIHNIPNVSLIVFNTGQVIVIPQLPPPLRNPPARPFDRGNGRDDNNEVANEVSDDDN